MCVLFFLFQPKIDLVSVVFQNTEANYLISILYLLELCTANDMLIKAYFSHITKCQVVGSFWRLLSSMDVRAGILQFPWSLPYGCKMAATFSNIKFKAEEKM